MKAMTSWSLERVYQTNIMPMFKLRTYGSVLARTQGVDPPDLQGRGRGKSGETSILFWVEHLSYFSPVKVRCHRIVQLDPE